MTTSLATVDNILKEVYEPQLQDQLQSEVTTLRRIERSTEGVTEETGGKYTTFPVRVRRNHGIGARAELQPLPTPRTQGYLSARINLKYLYGSIELTGQTMKLAETNRQSFASAMDQEMNGIKEGLAKDTNRQVYGRNTGILATATAAGSTTEFVTDNRQYLEEGMFVDVFDATDTNTTPVLNDSNVQITDIEETSPGEWTVTLDPAVTATAIGDFLTRNGSRGLEKTGFDQIVLGITDDHTVGDGTGVLYNITSPIWTGNVDSTAGALSEGRMIKMVHDIRTRGAGSPTVGFCSLGVQRAYFNLLVQQRRYTNTKEFAGGFTGLAFTVDNAEIPIVPDFDCQPGRLYFINEGEIKLYQAADWEWLDKGGSRWERKTDSSGRYDAWLADLAKYCEIGTHRRNAHGALINVTEAS